jgi:hypothetical protein
MSLCSGDARTKDRGLRSSGDQFAESGKIFHKRSNSALSFGNGCGFGNLQIEWRDYPKLFLKIERNDNVKIYDRIDIQTAQIWLFTSFHGL